MIKLNCDLGESYGAWCMPHDDLIMPYVDMANIACGFHSGDPQAIQAAIQSAAKHNVQIGAHPSYPDLQGFGRRSMAMTEDELIPLIHYQIAALQGMAKIQSKTVDYVKHRLLEMLLCFWVLLYFLRHPKCSTTTSCI